MKNTRTQIIGSSFSGLAVAACLQKKGLEYLLIEKEDKIATPWRNHYERLHLHTNKRISSLPFKNYDSKIPRYPSRLQVIEYLEDYQKKFGIKPIFNTTALFVKKEGKFWITQTNKETFKSEFLVVATGCYGKPRDIHFQGMETFPGKIIHSASYKYGRDFKGQKVLVVGFGNSACEIAIDLYEQGAMPFMSVRSGVNVIPRDVLGIPVVELGILNRNLAPETVDKLNAPLINLLVGNISKIGLAKNPYGPAVQIAKYGKIPVLDIGTIKLIRKGHIKIHAGIEFIDGNTVHFSDGKTEDINAIVAAIGFEKNYPDSILVDKSRFEDLKVALDKQQFFGKDGLYFCGFWVSPTGQIREISLDAQKIALDIEKKSSVSKKRSV